MEFPVLLGKIIDAQLDAILASWEKSPVTFLLNSFITVLLLLVMHYYLFMYPRERLTLSSTGISFYSPLPSFLQWLRPSWSLSWSNIKEAELILIGGARRMEFVHLRLRGKEKPRHLKISEWHEEQANKKTWWHTPFFQPIFIPIKKSKFDAQLQRSPLLNGLKGFDIAVSGALDKPAHLHGFDLNSTPQTQRVMLAMALLGLYIVIDAIANSETYVDTPPYPLMLTCGAILVVITARWLISSNIPKVESLGMGLLLGAIFSIALYSGLLRVNQFTGGELHSVEYRLGDNRRLYPTNNQYPVINLKQDEPAYWLAQKPGESYDIMLRHGGLGFFQFDKKPIYTRYRKFYDR